MESNVNFKSIEQYCITFSNIIVGKSFDNRTKISGQEILKVTSIKQLNLFIIYELFKKWKEETENLKSPYFNYDNPDVQNDLKKFLNTLSKNISVEESDFLQFCTTATLKTILLIFSPYEFFKQEFNQTHNSRLKFDDLIELKKYLRINQHLLTAYIERFESESIQEIFNEDAIAIFDEVCESLEETPEDITSYVDEFSKICSLNIDDFYSEQVVLQFEDGEEANSGDSIVESKTLNDLLQKESETLADKHQKKKIDGLKKNITINQRIMFVKNLFDGDVDEFESIVSFIDNCSEKQEAMDFVNHNCIDAKNWDKDSEEVQEFVEIVDNRFS